MKERLVTGFSLLFLTFLFLIYSSQYLFGVGVFFVALLSIHEWLNLLRIENVSMPKYLIISAIIIFVFSEFFVHLHYVLPLFWFYAIVRLFMYEKGLIDNLSQKEMLVMGLFAIVPFSPCLYILHSNGIFWVFMIVSIISSADSGAYFIGKTVGKYKVLPRLSPNKTLEGLIGGVLVASVVSIIFLCFIDLSLFNYILMFFASMIVACMSFIGDVFESMIKRVTGSKDSGNLLPGHGGVLDRLDGYMPSLPIFVIFGYYSGVFSL